MTCLHLQAEIGSDLDRAQELGAGHVRELPARGPGSNTLAQAAQRAAFISPQLSPNGLSHTSSQENTLSPLSSQPPRVQLSTPILSQSPLRARVARKRLSRILGVCDSRDATERSQPGPRVYRRLYLDVGSGC